MQECVAGISVTPTVKPALKSQKARAILGITGDQITANVIGGEFAKRITTQLKAMQAAGVYSS